jgi:hypothetical protein
LETIIIVLIIVTGVILFFIFKDDAAFAFRSKALKKEDICQNYIDELKNVLNGYDTKEQKIEQKKIFLQRVNSELSRNIFFTEEEAKELIKKLSVV